MSRPPRIPGMTSRRGRVLYVLPEIPDAASTELKNALALRNAANVSGVCPSCGCTGELTTDADGFLHLTFAHEVGCGVFTDDEAAA